MMTPYALRQFAMKLLNEVKSNDLERTAYGVHVASEGGDSDVHYLRLEIPRDLVNTALKWLEGLKP